MSVPNDFDKSLPHLMIMGVWDRDRIRVYELLSGVTLPQDTKIGGFHWSKVKLTTVPYEMIVSLVHTRSEPQVAEVLNQYKPSAVILTAHLFNDVYVRLIQLLLKLTDCPILSLTTRVDRRLIKLINFPPRQNSETEHLPPWFQSPADLLDYSSPTYESDTVEYYQQGFDKEVKRIRGHIFNNSNNCNRLEFRPSMIDQSEFQTAIDGLFTQFPQFKSIIMNPDQIRDWVFNHIKVSLKSIGCRAKKRPYSSIKPDLNGDD